MTRHEYHIMHEFVLTAKTTVDAYMWCDVLATAHKVMYYCRLESSFASLLVVTADLAGICIALMCATHFKLTLKDSSILRSTLRQNKELSEFGAMQPDRILHVFPTAPLADAQKVSVIFTGVVRGYIDGFDVTFGETAGGIARLTTAINELKSDALNAGRGTLLLDLGQVMGYTAYDIILKGQPQMYYLNQMKYDAVGVGDSDFFLGQDETYTWYTGKTFAVISSTLEFINENQMANVAVKSHTVSVVLPGGSQTVDIGILSYTSSTFCRSVVCTSESGIFKTIVNDLKVALVTEEAKLIAAGVTNIVLLSSSNLNGNYDSTLVPALEEVDFHLYSHQVGEDLGESNWYGTNATEFIQYETNKKGKEVITAGLYYYGIYTGNLDMDFGQNPPTLLSSSRRLLRECVNASYPAGCVMEDSAMKTYMGTVEAQMEAAGENLLTHTDEAHSNGNHTCRRQNCTLGTIYATGVKESLPSCQIGLVNGGAIREGFQVGPITFVDLLAAYPFTDQLRKIEIKGNILFSVLEHSVSFLPTNISNDTEWNTAVLEGGTGAFLHFAGLRFLYDSKRKVGSRVFNVEVLQQVSSGETQWIQADRESVYSVCLSTFLYYGGDGYTMFNESLSAIDYGATTLSSVQSYIAKTNPKLTYFLGFNSANEDFQYSLSCGTKSCINGLCHIYSQCSCYSGWAATDCGVVSPNSTNLTSYCDVGQDSTYYPLDVDLVEVSIGGYIYTVTVLVGLVGIFVFGAIIVWRHYLRHWSITQTQPDTADNLSDDDLKSNFKIEELEKSGTNLIAIVQFVFESLQTVAFAFIVQVDWDWPTILSAMVRLVGTRISNEWVIWLISSLSLLWIIYALILISEADGTVSQYAIGRLFLLPSATYLSFYAGVGYVPTVGGLLEVFNCQAVSVNGVEIAFVHQFCPSECFGVGHWVMMAMATICLVLYAPLMIYTVHVWQELDRYLQLKFNPKYLLLVLSAKSCMIVAKVFFGGVSEPYLAILICVYITMGFITFKYPPCNVVGFNYFVPLPYMAGLFASITLLVLIVIDNQSGTTAALCSVLPTTIFIVVYFMAACKRTTLKLRRKSKVSLQRFEVLKKVIGGIRKTSVSPSEQSGADNASNRDSKSSKGSKASHRLSVFHEGLLGRTYDNYRRDLESEQWADISGFLNNYITLVVKKSDLPEEDKLRLIAMLDHVVLNKNKMIDALYKGTCDFKRRKHSFGNQNVEGSESFLFELNNFIILTLPIEYHNQFRTLTTSLLTKKKSVGLSCLHLNDLHSEQNSKTSNTDSSTSSQNENQESNILEISIKVPQQDQLSVNSEKNSSATDIMRTEEDDNSIKESVDLKVEHSKT
eukprot:Nk52_evm15s375 gene=Nk52_evmTU15s375